MSACRNKGPCSVWADGVYLQARMEETAPACWIVAYEKQGKKRDQFLVDKSAARPERQRKVVAARSSLSHSDCAAESVAGFRRIAQLR